MFSHRDLSYKNQYSIILTNKSLSGVKSIAFFTISYLHLISSLFLTDDYINASDALFIFIFCMFFLVGNIFSGLLHTSMCNETTPTLGQDFGKSVYFLLSTQPY
jgi:hypothetical protein